MLISKFINHNSSNNNVPRYIILKAMSQNSETGITSGYVLLIRKDYLFALIFSGALLTAEYRPSFVGD